MHTHGNNMDDLLARWTRAGAGFNVEPATGSIDLERLLLDTARHALGSARVFTMAATWLHRYGELVARHRLKRLIRDELEPADRPILGLLLDTAQQGTHPLRFATITKDLSAAEQPGPLFEVERRTPTLGNRAERRASALSRRWGCWCAPVEWKLDALRPPHWVFEQNAEFLCRADYRGDLRASVVAALMFDEGAEGSELALARASGGSRAQVRQALANLELTGRVGRVATPRGRRAHVRSARFQPA